MPKTTIPATKRIAGGVVLRCVIAEPEPLRVEHEAVCDAVLVSAKTIRNMSVSRA